VETNLYGYILKRSFRLQLLLIGISFVLGLVINPLMLDLSKRIINAAIAQGNLRALLVLTGAFLVTVLVNGALKFVKQNLEGYISETMLRDLRTELHRRILRFPLPHFRSMSAGQLVAMVLGEVEELGAFFGEALSTPAFQGAMFVGTVGYMIYANPWMALIAGVLFPVQAWLVRRLQRRMGELSRQRVRMARGVSDRVQESVGTIQEIYVNDTTRYESWGFRGLLSGIFVVRLQIYRLRSLIRWINNFLEKFGQFVLLLGGGWLIITRPGSFDVGTLVAFLQAYNQLNDPWRELISYFQAKENARVKYETVISAFDPPGLRPDFGLGGPAEPPAVLTGAYELRQVSVVLDGTTHALDRLQLAIAAHEHVAVAGTPGSGKSSLAMLLARLSDYEGTVLLDGRELSQLPLAAIGRQVGYVGPEAKLVTGTVFDNAVYGLRHRPSGAGDEPDGDGAPDRGADAWLDLSPLAAPDRGALVEAVLETLRLVGFDEDLFQFGLRTTIDPAARADLAARILTARRLVIERFAGEAGEAAVEFFDRDRFAAYASIGENILFGQSTAPELALDRLGDHPHFRRVVAEVGLEEPLLELGLRIARDMVEIFKDISAENELFARFSLIQAAELADYTQLVARLERTGTADLTAPQRERLLRLALRLIPARHRLGGIDEAFMAMVVAARKRFAESLPPALAARFAPYDREQYFADGTILENLLFGKVVATSALAVKKVNAIVEDVVSQNRLREVVMEVGLDYSVGLLGGRLTPAQRQRLALARTLLKRPQVVIMDAALMALEHGERVELHQRLTQALKGRTVIAVVERLDLARFYDRVVVLDHGRVAESGTYQDLLSKDGLFHQLAEQAGAAR
jgi:ABC-type multidrug transport system fused ATPase/permease subunit